LFQCEGCLMTSRDANASPTKKDLHLFQTSLSLQQ
jgi:hypothetical protein